MIFLRKNISWLLPTALFFLLLPFSASLDLKVSHIFYQGEGNFLETPFLTNVYHLGIYPAWLLVGMALVCLVLPFCRRFWKESVYMLLVLAIGSGLVVHLVLKDHFGRPRPRQVVEFGGKETFTAAYEPAWSLAPRGKSFSCGHCTMGFYFFGLYFIGRKRHWPKVCLLGLSMGFGLGGLLSLTRIAQGGHFFLDTLASALIMWVTADLLARGVLYERAD